MPRTKKTVSPTPARQSVLPPEPAGRYDAVVFSIIDWDFRFQRPQQLATQFGRHGHRVFYLSTTRFLAPGGAAWDLSRKAEGVAELRIRSGRPLDIYRGRLNEEDLDALALGFLAKQAGLPITWLIAALLFAAAAPGYLLLARVAARPTPALALRSSGLAAPSAPVEG